MKGLWQPVETAPKDGTRVLLYWQGFTYPYEVGYWVDSADVEYGKEVRRRQYWSGSYSRNMLGKLHERQPSHWMPLEPPEG